MGNQFCARGRPLPDPKYADQNVWVWVLFSSLNQKGWRSRHAENKSSKHVKALTECTKPSLGAKKSTQTFFVQSFSKTLRVMDVRAKNRGRPHQKMRFSAAPVMGRNFLTQGRPGVRVRNVRGKFGPKSLCLCCFFFPESHSQSLANFVANIHSQGLSAARTKISRNFNRKAIHNR